MCFVGFTEEPKRDKKAWLTGASPIRSQWLANKWLPDLMAEKIRRKIDAVFAIAVVHILLFLTIRLFQRGVLFPF